MGRNEDEESRQAQGQSTVNGVFFRDVYFVPASWADQLAVERDIQRLCGHNHIASRADSNILEVHNHEIFRFFGMLYVFGDVLLRINNK